MELPPDFIHEPPEGYSYIIEDFKRGVLAIWLLHHREYIYASDDVRTIWGFYAPRKQQYYAPINAKKVGNPVNIDETRPYTAMQLNLNPLMAAFG